MNCQDKKSPNFEKTNERNKSILCDFFEQLSHQSKKQIKGSSHSTLLSQSRPRKNKLTNNKEC